MKQAVEKPAKQLYYHRRDEVEANVVTDDEYENFGANMDQSEQDGRQSSQLEAKDTMGESYYSKQLPTPDVMPNLDYI